MKQLLLDLDSQILPSLTTFVVGQNAELAQLLGLFAQRTPSLYGERSVYIWGETGAGKTHLLHALADHPHSRYIPATAPEPAFEFRRRPVPAVAGLAGRKPAFRLATQSPVALA